MECKQVGILTGGKWDKMHECIRRVYDTDAISPTITSGGVDITRSRSLYGTDSTNG